MIAFEVSLNGEHICTAGVEDFGIISAMAMFVRRRPEKTRERNTIEEELAVEVSGLDSRDPNASEHLIWLLKTLKVGDSFSIHVVNVDKVDAPTRHYLDDPVADAKAKREYYEELKKEFGD